MGHLEIQLRKQILRTRLLDVAKTIARELLPWIQHDEVRRIELAADVVHANRDEAFGTIEQVPRLPAAAHNHRLVAMPIPEVRETPIAAFGGGLNARMRSGHHVWF